MQTPQSVHWPPPPSPVDGAPQQPATDSDCSHLIWFSSGQSNKTQGPFSLFSVPAALFPYILAEPLWFISDAVAALSMRWAKGTLGNFMIHDEASGIILDVCMCQCILIMASVSWKRQHTFKGDNLIFSPLSHLSSPRSLILCLPIPVRGAIAYIVHLGFRVIKRRNRKW